MGDVRPLPLTDDEDFFSDLGSDEPYAGEREVGSGGRLTLSVEGPVADHRTSRSNPFSSTEIRSRNNGNVNITNSAAVEKLDQSSDDNSTNETTHATSRTRDALVKPYHCHVHNEDPNNNTVRNQLIAISICTTIFGAGETAGECIKMGCLVRFVSQIASTLDVGVVELIIRLNVD